MRLFKEFWFVPFLLAGFFGILYLGSRLQAADEINPPAWSPTGDQLASMSHHDALICANRVSGAPAPKVPTNVLATFNGGLGGQQLLLYPSNAGLCGVLDMSQFSITPVLVMLNPLDPELFTSFTATYWEPTRQPEPALPYTWATAALTERMDRWWIQFTFRSTSEPVTTVTLGVD